MQQNKKLQFTVECRFIIEIHSVQLILSNCSYGDIIRSFSTCYGPREVKGDIYLLWYTELKKKQHSWILIHSLDFSKSKQVFKPKNYCVLAPSIWENQSAWQFLKVECMYQKLLILNLIHTI